MKTVLVFGIGKVGTLVGILLKQRFDVTGFDKNIPAEPIGFECIQGDIHDQALLEKTIPKFDAVVSCMPYNLNLSIALIAHAHGVHYFVTKLRDIELRVGALPRYPNGLLAYSFTWSPAGVINEYINDAEVIHNRVRKMVPSLDGIESINIEGRDYEAFTTSGGLGTMCRTYEGKVDTLNYKTIRYPGHAQLMRFLLYELILKEKRELVETILTEAKPPVADDVVLVYTVVEGWKGEALAREEYYSSFHPIYINGKKWRAISWTTAASIAAVVEMVADKKLPQKGFIKQEEIDFNTFMETKNGQLFKG